MKVKLNTAFFKVLASIKGEKMAEKIVHVGSEDFEEVLGSGTPVFVDFYADWCGPCRMVAPVVERLAEEYDGKVKFVKLDVDENPDIAARFGVMSIPTLMIFKNGKQMKRIIGASSIEHYRREINNVLVGG